MSESTRMEESRKPDAARGSVAHRLYTGSLSYDFIRSRRKWFLITLTAVVVSLLVLVFKQLTLGIEFRGGTDFQVPTQVQASTVADVRQATKKYEVKELDAQVFSIGDTAIRIQTRPLTSAEIAQTRTDIAHSVGSSPDDVTYNTIGGSWGDKISKGAAVAVTVFLVLVMCLIALYFRDWRMALAAIIALGHDVIVTLGVYALVGFTVTPSTLIGLLTILGYSLYDTVVVFDKVKENTHNITKGNRTFSWQANLAINQVLIRSINTTIIGILPVLAMFLAGVYGNSNPLKDLGLALLVGMVAGTFSSIFIATPLLAWFKERTPAMTELREQIERRAARAEHRGLASEHADGEAAAAATAAPAVATHLERRQRRTHSTRAERRGKR